ncbi:MAG TPA: MFS transporter [Acidimicrobiales bacterium]|nr:MFS transporter [Acidimicrobiales bacterium]
MPAGAAARPPVDLGPSPFARLALAHALATAGDALVTMALAGSLFFDISPGAARGKVILSLVLTMAPFAVVGPLLGPVLERLPGGRRLMLALAAAARVLTCLAMAEVVDRLLLFPAAFAFLVLSKTHAVTKSALVPAVVSSEAGLVEANAKLSLGSVAVGVVAAVPGIALLQLAGAEWVLRLAAAVFAVGAVAALRVRTIRPDDAGRAEAAAEELAHSGIRVAAVAMGVLRGGVGFLAFLVAFALRRDGAPSWVFGVVLLASMAGTASGAGLAPLARRSVREEHLLTAALGLVGVGALAAAWLDGRPGAVVAAVVLGLSASTGKLAFDSLVQRDAPDAVQARRFARFETMFQLAWVVGALVPVVLSTPQRDGLLLLATAGFAAAVGYGFGRR